MINALVSPTSNKKRPSFPRVGEEVFEGTKENDTDVFNENQRRENEYSNTGLPHIKQQNGLNGAPSSCSSFAPPCPLTSSNLKDQDRDKGLGVGFSRKDALVELRRMLALEDPLQRARLHSELLLCAAPSRSPSASSPSSSCPISSLQLCPPGSPHRNVELRALSQLREVCQWWLDWCSDTKRVYRERRTCPIGEEGMASSRCYTGTHGFLYGSGSTGEVTQDETPVGTTGILFQHVMLEYLRYMRNSTPTSSSTAMPTTTDMGTGIAPAVRALPSRILSHWRSETREIHRLLQEVKGKEEEEEMHNGEETKGMEAEKWQRDEGTQSMTVHQGSEMEKREGLSSSLPSPIPSISAEGPRRGIAEPTFGSPPSSTAAIPVPAPAAAAAAPATHEASRIRHKAVDSQDAWFFALERRLQRTAPFRVAVEQLVKLLPAPSCSRAAETKKGGVKEPQLNRCRYGNPDLCGMGPTPVAMNTKGKAEKISSRRKGSSENGMECCYGGDEEEEEEEVDDFHILTEAPFPYPHCENVFPFADHPATTSSFAMHLRHWGRSPSASSSSRSTSIHLSRYLSRLELLSPLISEAVQRLKMMKLIHCSGILMEGGEEIEERRKSQRNEKQENVTAEDGGDGGKGSVELLQNWKDMLQDVHEKSMKGSLLQLQKNLDSVKQRCAALNISVEGYLD